MNFEEKLRDINRRWMDSLNLPQQILCSEEKTNKQAFLQCRSWQRMTTSEKIVNYSFLNQWITWAFEVVVQLELFDIPRWARPNY